jgi:hypothetical protein
MATNEMKKGCGLSTEAVLASNQKRRRDKSRQAQSSKGCLLVLVPLKWSLTGVAGFATVSWKS